MIRKFLITVLPLSTGIPVTLPIMQTTAAAAIKRLLVENPEFNEYEIISLIRYA